MNSKKNLTCSCANMTWVVYEDSVKCVNCKKKVNLHIVPFNVLDLNWMEDDLSALNNQGMIRENLHV
jgi:hypothetical protein